MKHKLNKKIFAICFLFLFIFSIFKIGKGFAETKAFSLVDATIKEKSDTAKASISKEDDKIVSDVTFHKVSDYVIYKLSFKNLDNQDYTIKSIKDDNINPYVVYSYDEHKDEVIKAGETKDVLVKVSYENSVTNTDKRESNDKVTFSFNLVDKYGNHVESNISINPKTNDNVILYVAIAVISLGGCLVLFIKNNKTKKALVLVIMLTPFIAKAVDSSFTITFNSDIKLYDKLVATIDVNGEKETVLVDYNNKLDEPETPEKRGYNFLGWYNGDQEYDFDKAVEEDVNLTAKYEIINYDINFELNGGVALLNPITYNVETDSITLNNPVKPGYSFTGWTGTLSDTPQTRVTIDKGSIGDLEFIANFSADDDTTYMVRHRYLSLDGNSYEEVEEPLTGTTDTTVKPAAMSRTGFINPELQDLKIDGSGESELIYVYDREMYTLSYNEDVETDFEQKQYKYGTPITVSAKEKTGYTFNKWNVNTNASPVFIDMDDIEGISLGDIVIIGTDWFHVIAPEENGEVKLLPQFNLNSEARQSIFSDNSDNIVYSSIIYWENSSDYTPFGSSSHKYIYRTTADRLTTDGDTNNYLRGRINSYKEYLNNYVTVNDARLMSYEEAIATSCEEYVEDSCPTWVANQHYWLGSAYGSSGVWIVNDHYRDLYSSYYAYDFGVRPVVIISSSDISFTEDSSSQSTFNIEEDTYVAPSYNPNKNTPYSVVHKLQDQDDESVYTTETENKTGITGDTITPDIKTTYGSDYIVPNKETTTIAADGSTTVTYTYNYRYYNILYDANGGTVNTESSKVYKGNETTPPTPTWSGYIFTGWYDAAEGGNLIAAKDASFTPTRSITLYAHWEENNNSIAYLTDLDNDLDISLGDKVTIGEDEFYFIGRDDNGYLKLLAKYNLDNEYRQSENNYEPVAFSSINYWDEAGSSSSSSSSSGSGFSSSYSFNTDDQGNKYVYRTSDNSDVAENYQTSYINNYKSHLENDLGINIIDAKLMSYDEAISTGCTTSYNSCPDWVDNQDYFLGSVIDKYYVIVVSNYLHSLGNNEYHYAGAPGAGHDSGARPVIIVSESDISMPWDNNDTLFYSDTDNDGNISLGDTVRIGSEGFRVIDTPSNGEVKLLAMYNLDSTPRQSKNSDTMAYSTGKYLDNSSDYTPFGSSSYNYIYRTTADRFTTDGDTKNNLKTRINSYKDYLNGLNIVTINDARLMSYEEALVTGCSHDDYSCPTWVANQMYWLGSADYNNHVWCVDDYLRFLYLMTFGQVNGIGVRPLITINESDIPTA